jgi:exoribonuclease R
MTQRLVVAIDGWEPDSAYPHGHYVRSLGEIGSKDTETVGTAPARVRAPPAAAVFF